MKLDPHLCPECGEPARMLTEMLYALAYLTRPADDGTCEYEGESKVCWDSQSPDVDADGHVFVQCENGHQWQADYEDLEPNENRNAAEDET